MLWLAANTHELGSLAQARAQGPARRRAHRRDRRARRTAAGVPDGRGTAARSLPAGLRATAWCSHVRPLHDDAPGRPHRGARGRARSERRRRISGGSRGSTSRRRKTRRSSRMREGMRTLEMMRWGLVPFWAGEDGREAAADDQRARRVDASRSRCFAMRSSASAASFLPTASSSGEDGTGKRDEDADVHPSGAITSFFAFAGLWARAKYRRAARLTASRS